MLMCGRVVLATGYTRMQSAGNILFPACDAGRSYVDHTLLEQLWTRHVSSPEPETAVTRVAGSPQGLHLSPRRQVVEADPLGLHAGDAGTCARGF